MCVGSKGANPIKRLSPERIDGILADYSKNKITFALVCFLICPVVQSRVAEDAHISPATMRTLPLKCSSLTCSCLRVHTRQWGLRALPCSKKPVSTAQSRDVMHVCHLQASGVSEEILKTEYDSVRLLYSSFKSAISFKPTIATVLSPETLEKSDKIAEMMDQYEIEGPDRPELLQDLGEYQLACMMYYAMNENCTSEHASRMQVLSLCCLQHCLPALYIGGSCLDLHSGSPCDIAHLY